MRKLLKWLLVIAFAIGLWGGVVLAVAAVDLTGARADLRQAKGHTRAFEFSEARRELRSADGRLSRAGARLDALPVAVLGRAPVIGDDVRAVVSIVDGASAAVDGAGFALEAADALPDPDRLALVDGRFPSIDWTEVGAASSKAAKAFARARALVMYLPQDLLDPIDRARTEFLSETAEAWRASESLQEGATILPDLLGQKGRRRHLIVIQNAAERRATGGAIESFLLLEARDRRIRVVRADPDEAITGTATDPDAAHGYNLDPDFSAVGVRIADAYNESTGIAPDTVIAMDQVALAELIGATGPVTVEGKTIAGKDAVRFLSRDILFDYPVEPGQSIFLGKLSKAISTRVLAGDLRVPRLAEGLGRAAAAKHILVWARDAATQSAIQRLDLAGIVDFARDPDDPIHIGIFGNNPSVAEMDYYARRSIALDVYLHDDRTADVAVTVALRNEVKRGDLPGVVLAKSGFGVLRQRVTLWVGEPEPVGIKKASVAPGRTKKLSFPSSTVGIGGKRAYLVFLRQPGLFPDDVSVRVHLPPGASALRREGLDGSLRYRGKPDGDLTFDVAWR